MSDLKSLVDAFKIMITLHELDEHQVTNLFAFKDALISLACCVDLVDGAIQIVKQVSPVARFDVHQTRPSATSTLTAGKS